MEWKVLRTYKGDQLAEIALPVGGIGTGFFSLGGRGDFADWQISNRPSRGWKPEYSHLLLRTESGQKVRLRVLEGELTRGASADFGNPEPLAGIPRFPVARFEAAFPFGRVVLEDGDVPLEVSIEAFNPLVPRNEDSSGIPVGLLTLNLKNRTDQPVSASLTFLLDNFIGADSVEGDRKNNLTEAIRFGSWSGFCMAKRDPQPSPAIGTLTALWDRSDVAVARRVKVVDRAWRHDVLSMIDQLLAHGILADQDPSSPCPPSGDSGWLSAASIKIDIPQRGEASARLLIAWHFPWRFPHRCGWDLSAEKDYSTRNYYAMRYADASEVASKTLPALDLLRNETVGFVNAVVNRDIPEPLKEAALFNLGGLRSHTSFRLEDGTFVGFEGCGDQSGCCAGSCSHVWNYEQATISLFPNLHRSMLDTHLGVNVTSEGGDRFRVSLPLAQPTFDAAAADGQMGIVVRVYLQYLADGDRRWLAERYGQMKKLVEFAWIPGGWDADRDGVMEGAQHNTYDVEFFGPNPLCTGWYLAALASASKVAEIVGDSDFRDECDALCRRGSAWMDQYLYNGSFYFQQPAVAAGVPDPMTIAGDNGASRPDRYQVGPGCLIDQLVGQYKANRAGLGDLLDRFHLQKAVLSIYENNYCPSLQNHYNNMRSFAYGDEAGTVICSYPEGKRPEIPFPYWSECMTGFEYQLAVLLLDYGYRSEAVRVVSAVRNRHDGRRRNPFNEPECGSFYARAMASWALLDAWEGHSDKSKAAGTVAG